MARVRVGVLRAAGTNCDQETAYAFKRAGAEAELVHINRLVRREKQLEAFHVLAIPGGFTYGDDVAAGKVLANELRFKLKTYLVDFIRQGRLVIGICNGFQVLVKAGILPGDKDLTQKVTLMLNDSARFEDRWVYLKNQKSKIKNQKCVWTQDLPEIIYLPVAHGEGKFVAQDKTVLEDLKQSGQIVFRYCDEKGAPADYPYNPNGSQEDIAGICDETGRIFGLMPHPERHILPTQHPRWMREGLKDRSDGLRIFENGVKFAEKHL